MASFCNFGFVVSSVSEPDLDTGDSLTRLENYWIDMTFKRSHFMFFFILTFDFFKMASVWLRFGHWLLSAEEFSTELLFSAISMQGGSGGQHNKVRLLQRSSTSLPESSAEFWFQERKPAFFALKKILLLRAIHGLRAPGQTLFKKRNLI
jgi:hypothetical protein